MSLPKVLVGALIIGTLLMPGLFGWQVMKRKKEINRIKALEYEEAIATYYPPDRLICTNKRKLVYATEVSNYTNTQGIIEDWTNSSYVKSNTCWCYRNIMFMPGSSTMNITQMGYTIRTRTDCTKPIEWFQYNKPAWLKPDGTFDLLSKEERIHLIKQ